jgi:hypothetical protein
MANPAPLAPTPRPSRACALSVAGVASSSFSVIEGSPESSTVMVETARASSARDSSREAFFRVSPDARGSSTTPEDREARRATHTAAARLATAVAASHHEVSPRAMSAIYPEVRGELILLSFRNRFYNIASQRSAKCLNLLLLQLS